MTTTTIDPAEAAHFGALAADWWDSKGSSAMLHRLNPVRLRFVREQIDAHWGGNAASFRPLAGKTALDVGCGAGLLTEPLARLGARVTGLDAAPENIAAARAHAEGQGLPIDYRCEDVAAIEGQFDLVTSMEVVEHVADPAAFIAALAARLAPDGLMILSTPNRTGLSKLAMITLGEGLGAIPKGTHEWDKFLTPEELEGFLTAAGLTVIDRRGLSFSPAAGFTLSGDLRLNYLLAATHAVDATPAPR
jgi:2-polyprenyl-6-hydroxyphenyl methylase / 3-demethylubiquinone-9 3-methyltransferase